MDKSPQNDDLAFPEGELPDDDPEVAAGMNRLAHLRAAENELSEFCP